MFNEAITFNRQLRAAAAQTANAAKSYGNLVTPRQLNQIALLTADADATANKVCGCDARFLTRSAAKKLIAQLTNN